MADAYMDKLGKEWDRDPGYTAEGIIIELNERICKIMSEKEISRAELGRRLGKSRAYVTRMLNGLPNMTIMTIAKVSIALGVDSTELLWGKHSTDESGISMVPKSGLCRMRKRKIEKSEPRRAGAKTRARKTDK